MTVKGNDSKFSESDLSLEVENMFYQRRAILNLIHLIIFSDTSQPGTEIFNMPASTPAGNQTVGHSFSLLKTLCKKIEKLCDLQTQCELV